MSGEIPRGEAFQRGLMSELMDPAVADCPLVFVKTVYPWGKTGTPLAAVKEPRAWQCDELLSMTDHIRDNRQRVARGEQPRIYRSATCSGHGTGKGALTSWLKHWMMSTRWGSTSIDSANTFPQLETRTWAEAGKWLALATNRDWFRKTTMKIEPDAWFKRELEAQGIGCDYFYAQGQMWREEEPEAFAGVHSHIGVLLIFDEASGIPDEIWRVSKGFFTDPTENRFFFAWSQGRRNTGQFYQCFHADREQWKRRHLNALEVEGTDKEYLNDIVKVNGKDSYDARVLVFGKFPDQSTDQFIPVSSVEDAMSRSWTKDDEYGSRNEGLVMGIDPARYGDDSTVFQFRRGRDARHVPPVTLKGLDTMEIANAAVDEIDAKKPLVVYVDEGGLGAGVHDRLRERLRGYRVRVVGVNFGSKSHNARWADRRTEIWARMRDWLPGSFLDSSDEMKRDLIGPGFVVLDNGQTRLETKASMKARGLKSPDRADALAVTFAENGAVMEADHGNERRKPTMCRDLEYSYFG